MKKLLIVAVGVMLAAFSSYAQDYVREGNEFSSVRTVKEKPEDVKTGFVWKTSGGEKYDIYITKNNACYTIRTSQKTGNEYRAYLPKEASAEIAKELGRDVEKPSN